MLSFVILFSIKQWSHARGIGGCLNRKREEEKNTSQSIYVYSLIVFVYKYQIKNGNEQSPPKNKTNVEKPSIN